MAAADQDALMNMVLGFRVPELQELMAFVGRSQTGRLEDLQRSALDLLRNYSIPVHTKIRELHSLRHPFQAMASPAPPDMALYPPYQGPPFPYGASAGPFFGYPQPNSAWPNWNPWLFIPPGVSAFHGSSAAAGSPFPHPTRNAPPSNESFNQPKSRFCQVRFKPLPFYEVVTELLRPTTTVPERNKTNFTKSRDVSYLFSLTPDQARDILNSKSSVRNEFRLQVHLRCCLVDTSCEQDDNFPNNIWVKINRFPCPLPKPVVGAGEGPRRPSRPVEITSSVDLTPSNASTNSTSPLNVINQLFVTWDLNDMGKYALAVHLVRKVTADQLIKEFKSRGIRHQDYTKDMIKAKLKEGRESEISTTNFRVSLLCPLGKRRMEFPCRASSCSHVQCFDAVLYIQLNEVTSTWTCPVCYQSAPFNTLYRDGLFTGILEVAEEDRAEIVFLEDGSWEQGSDKNEAIGSAGNTDVLTVDCEINLDYEKTDVIKVEVV